MTSWKKGKRDNENEKHEIMETKEVTEPFLHISLRCDFDIQRTCSQRIWQPFWFTSHQIINLHQN